MATRGGKAAVAGQKRTRQDRVYQDKGKIQTLLGFDTEKAFDEWRESPLVKPWWDTYIASSHEAVKGNQKKLVDEENLIHRIREGERLGKRRYLAARTSPVYDDAEDYHAWLVFWLSEENSTDRKGCFWNKRLDQHTMYSRIHKFVLWARRQKRRTSQTAGGKKPKGTKSTTAADPASEELESAFGSDDEELDEDKGIAIVRWTKGIPDELEETDDGDRLTIERLCSHSVLTFWKAVDEGFALSEHMQRRTYLGPKDGSTFKEAQTLATKTPGNKKIFFRLETEPASIPEEAQSVPDTNVPALEGDAVREAAYKEMVDEAVEAGANRFDMNVRLWQYNLMFASANDSPQVNFRDVTATIQAIQYTHDLRSLKKELVDDDTKSNASDDDGSCMPLTEIRDISEEEIQRYHEMNQWIDNPAYQPQNHEEACKNLGIPNHAMPRIDGLLPSITLDRHQPTAINALIEFEDSCVGGGLNAEEVGLGKTVEMIGLFLVRSNQRREAIARGEKVPDAKPTLIVLPQNLIQQWCDEIFQFTDRFTVVVYYGPYRKSSDKQIVYIPKTETKGRLTRSHRIFNGDEENADTIVLTSYATYTARHGPKVQWNWLSQQYKEQEGNKRKTKAQVDSALIAEGIYYQSIHQECPHQLYGLFERIVIDEGHTIRHQSDDIGWTTSNTGSRHRHILSGTPTFDSVEEFIGLMRFLQNPQLSEEEHLVAMGFNEEQLTKGTHEKPGEVTPLESALYWADPYSFDDDDPRVPLRYTAEAMEKYLFNKTWNAGQEYGTEEQGQRLSEVLRKIMIRRTQSSLLNGVPIGRSLPSVQRMVFVCEFTADERAYYDYMMQDEATSLFKKSKDDKAVEWVTTSYRKWCLLASWLGFQYILDYKASKLSAKRKTMSALSILQDVQKGQDRMKVAKGKQMPITKETKSDDVQLILRLHCTGSPKLRQLLPILAEIVVLRKEKTLLWVNNPAQAEWLEKVLALCDIKAASLRTDLRAGEQDKLLRDFNSPNGITQVLICSYMVSCAGLNLQKQCRTSIEFEPPANESIRVQELGRVRRRGQFSPWVRHITLLTKDTLNTKQDSEAILKNLPSLLTQLNMEVWGKADNDEEKSYRLGDFVLHEGKLCPADDAKVKGLNLKPLDADELLVQIQIQLLGREANVTGDTLRRQAKADLSRSWPKAVAESSPAEKDTAGAKDAAGEKGSEEAPMEALTPGGRLKFPDQPLWTVD